MKRVLFLAFIFTLIQSSVFAYYDDHMYRIETVDEARARHSAQNYETYKNNGYRAPLGGYSEKLGDPSPKGTLRPGYVNNGLNSNYNRNGYGLNSY